MYLILAAPLFPPVFDVEAQRKQRGSIDCSAPHTQRSRDRAIGETIRRRFGQDRFALHVRERSLMRVIRDCIVSVHRHRARSVLATLCQRVFVGQLDQRVGTLVAHFNYKIQESATAARNDYSYVTHIDSRSTSQEGGLH